MKKAKKDEGYYKKLYNKLKRDKFYPVVELKKSIVFYQMALIAISKKQPKGEIVLSKAEFESIEEDENLVDNFDKDKNVVFKVEKSKN